MRVFALSDVHIDYEENRHWLVQLSDFDYQLDLLILAGDLTDRLDILQQSFAVLSKKFKAVHFVPGNHDLWCRKDQVTDSIHKFNIVMDMAEGSGLHTHYAHYDDGAGGGVTIVPFLSWYDYSFGLPDEQLKMMWMDLRHCVWPDDMNLDQVTEFFHQRNYYQRVAITPPHGHTVISFSHFLPRIDLMPPFIPQRFRYIYPVLGSVKLEQQIRILAPDIHVYGHSHLNRVITIDGIKYINNAYGYPSESHITAKQLSCVWQC